MTKKKDNRPSLASSIAFAITAIFVIGYSFKVQMDTNREKEWYEYRYWVCASDGGCISTDFINDKECYVAQRFGDFILHSCDTLKIWERTRRSGFFDNIDSKYYKQKNMEAENLEKKQHLQEYDHEHVHE